MPKAAKGKGGKAKKDGNAPKGALSAYMWFCKDKRAEVKEEHPELTAPQIQAKLAEMWREIDEGEKSKFQEKAKKDKQRYLKEKKKYEEEQGKDAASDLDEDEDDD